VKMRWGVPKQKRHCAAYGGISHQVIIVQKQKDFVIDVGIQRTAPPGCDASYGGIRVRGVLELFLSIAMRSATRGSIFTRCAARPGAIRST
jgi:hypothetical protein